MLPGSRDSDARIERLEFLVGLLKGAVQSASSSLTFKPGSSAGGTTFSSWPNLVSSANQIPGMKTIFYDGSLQDPHVPAGNWNLDNCIIVGRIAPTGFGDVLTFDDGAKWSFTNVILLGVGFVSNSSSNISTFAGGAGGQVTIFDSIITCNAGKAPFFHVATDAGAFTFLAAHEILLGDGVTPVFQCDAPKEIEFNLSNHSVIFANATTGTGKIDFEFDPDVTIQTPQLAGAKMLQQGPFYTAASSANWSNSPPSNMTAALDRIAAKIGPIP